MPRQPAFADYPVNDFIYVDKTEQTNELISNHRRVFFSRPRRFGKSLPLNIIGTLFEKGVDPYFKDTWIKDHWSQPAYPVSRLNFLTYPTEAVSEFKRLICLAIRKFALKQGIGICWMIPSLVY